MAAHETDPQSWLVFELESRRALHVVAFDCCVRCHANNDAHPMTRRGALDPMARVPQADCWPAILVAARSTNTSAPDCPSVRGATGFRASPLRRHRHYAPRERGTHALFPGDTMAQASCEVCGNAYDKPFQVVMRGVSHTFDSFECAISSLAPQCTPALA